LAFALDAKPSDRVEPNSLRAQLLFFGRPTMKSLVVKHSIFIAAHKTSVSLEDAFWDALKEIAIARGTTLSNLVTSIDVAREQGNLSSCLRLFVLDFYRNRGIGAASAKIERRTL
jgi:predicted DNA-binding ribbon-helix-helix protein